jgi:hypothetical protein
MNTYTNIDASKTPFSPQGGMARLQGPAPNQYANAAVQQQFGDVYRAAGQKAAMDLSRAGTQAAAEYASRANAAQNESVLGGLQLLGQQQQNAYQRQQAMEDMAYGWMNKMQGGVLGGLL